MDDGLAAERVGTSSPRWSRCGRASADHRAARADAVGPGTAGSFRVSPPHDKDLERGKRSGSVTGTNQDPASHEGFRVVQRTIMRASPGARRPALYMGAVTSMASSADGSSGQSGGGERTERSKNTSEQTPVADTGMIGLRTRRRERPHRRREGPTDHLRHLLQRLSRQLLAAVDTTARCGSCCARPRRGCADHLPVHGPRPRDPGRLDHARRRRGGHDHARPHARPLHRRWLVLVRPRGRGP